MASRRVQKPQRKVKPGALAPELQFTLHLSEGQLNVLEKALDFYSRGGMGQLSELIRVVCEGRSEAYGSIMDHSRLCFESAIRYVDLPGGVRSISSPEISDEFRVAYDIQQVTRHALHTVRYYRDPEYRQNCGASVYGDMPRRYSAYEPTLPVLLMRPLLRR